MEIWRIDVHHQSLSRQPVPPDWKMLGGRGLSARILLDEVKPACDPWGPNNKLIFAPGLLTGHMLSSCDRLSVGGKSPLTGGIKESNAGGTTALAVTALGIHALILESSPVGTGSWVVVIDKDGIRFETADDLAGLGVYASAERLTGRYGKEAAISVVGPGGEMRLAAAGILNLDRDHNPTRINARGGLGAVMGSKGLKAIIWNSQGGAKPPLADPQAFRSAQKAFTQALLNHPQTAVYRDFGTAGLTMMVNQFGALPTRNFSQGRFEEAESISGDRLREILLERGGEADPSHICMPGCAIRCSNVFANPQGEAVVGPLEYETISLMGSNLGIGDLDQLARLNWEANDLGLDSIDIGAALGVAAEAGLMRFGDAARALELLDEIRRGTPLGRTLGHGAAMTAKVLGVRRAPVVKNQAMSAYDPRAIKGTGVTYATSPQGADHTAGLTVRAKVNHLDPQGQAELSRKVQINAAGYDTLGVCAFAGFGFAAAPETVPALLNARYGWETGPEILQELGRITLRLELEFNRQAGFTSADDRLPEWMTTEPLPPNAAVFDVPDADLDGVFNGL
jgi:aldehyde:ferredoxin oxidoreductase